MNITIAGRSHVLTDHDEDVGQCDGLLACSTCSLERQVLLHVEVIQDEELQHTSTNTHIKYDHQLLKIIYMANVFINKMDGLHINNE